MSVSVIICTRNRPDALRACLESMAASTVSPAEVLVVDQSTGSQSCDVATRVQSTTRLPIVHIPHDAVGQTKARNLGIKSSHSDIVAFTDDDCMVHEDWVGAIEQAFDAPGVRCVCGQTLPADHKNRPRETHISTLSCQRPKRLSGWANPVMIGRGNNMAFRRRYIVELGAFNERIGVGTPVSAGDDTDVFYRILETGGSIHYSPEAKVLHCQPHSWDDVVRKKRAYSISSAAVVGARARHGSPHAWMVLLGKAVYEFGYLLCGGLVRCSPRLTAIGWHSLVGGLHGLRYALDSGFCEEITETSEAARDALTTDSA